MNYSTPPPTPFKSPKRTERLQKPLPLDESIGRSLPLGAYDAFYIAVARVYDIPLLTTDARLARAPNLGITALDVRTERPRADAS